MTEKLKCNPILCFSLFLALISLLFTLIKTDISNIKTDVRNIYNILINQKAPIITKISKA